MSKSNNHARRSQWRTMRRCLNMLLRLLRGAATTDELRDIIRDEARQEHETELTEKALQRRFDEDKKRLQEWFHVELDYSRATGSYTLRHIGYPLLDLAEDALRALAFLEQTYSRDDAPMAMEVRELLKIITMLLPYDRVKEVQNVRGLMEMELGVADDDVITEDVWDAVKMSQSTRRRLEFDYTSPQQRDGQLRRHTVEPIRYFFDTVRKHYYLECFWVTSSSHKGIVDQKRQVMRFRMGRMSNPTVLPSHFPPDQRIPTKELVYEISRDIARSGVTRHFPDMQIFYQDDGRAKVVVASRNLFFDLRTLLHYGGNCRVVGGDEAVKKMKVLVQSLHQYYFKDKA